MRKKRDYGFMAERVFHYVAFAGMILLIAFAGYFVYANVRAAPQNAAIDGGGEIKELPDFMGGEDDTTNELKDLKR